MSKEAKMAMSENKKKMLAGELYYAFTPELMRAVTRRDLVVMWRDILGDVSPVAPELVDPNLDEAQFNDEPWIEPPINIDYGTNVRVGSDVFINRNCTILDTCLVTIGSRTLFGPNVSLYSGTHPLNPAVRNGTAGPELGNEIRIEEDCWIGGNVTVLPGVRIGRGATVGAGSVVVKDVEPFTVVAGNPAKLLRKIETSLDSNQEADTSKDASSDAHSGAEDLMAKATTAMSLEDESSE